MSTGGFKWKDKPSQDERNPRDDKRLERGYRDHEKTRLRSPVRDDVRSKFGDDYDTRYTSKTNSSDVASKFGPAATNGSGEGDMGEKKKKKEKKATGPKPTNEPMIIVNVNDRLGTKAAIPCLASDPISA